MPSNSFLLTRDRQGAVRHLRGWASTTLWRACALIALAGVAALGAEPLITRTELFEGGQGGYKLYRIPGIVVTKDGTILVYCEARKFTGGDWDTIDVEMRRSTDGGLTFSAPEVIAHVTVPITRSPVAIERKQGKVTDIT